LLDSVERVAYYRVVTDGADIHQVAAYGADAVFAASKFSVGDLVHVEGEMRTRKTQTADDKLKGRTRTIREFQVQKQMLIEKARSSPSESSGRLN
ncbi:MAG: single-stranded DNA-binding protein, partial [Methanobacterium sp.]|nr:single-stranded DNA-binding protein [Methanobacterium sp.]